MFKLIALLTILALAIPIMAGVPLPGSLQPEALGQFFSNVILYWTTLVDQIAQLAPGFS